MKAIRSKNTGIEMPLRRALFARGLRYRIHYVAAPGRPDIAFPSKKVAVFCDSEFWHGYRWKEREQRIHTNREYWIPKIERNMQRDREVNLALKKQGWTVLRFWGREILDDPELCVDRIMRALRL